MILPVHKRTFSFSMVAHIVSGNVRTGTYHIFSSMIRCRAMFVQAHTIFLVPCFVVVLYYAIIHISCIYHHFMLPFIVVFMANVRTCINTASTIWTVHWGNFEQLVVTLGHILLYTFTNYFLNINFSFITVSIYYVVHTVY